MVFDGLSFVLGVITGVSLADLELVVRCKDCKWIDLCKDPEYFEYKGANGFCSKGERKDEVKNG